MSPSRSARWIRVIVAAFAHRLQQKPVQASSPSSAIQAAGLLRRGPAQGAGVVEERRVGEGRVEGLAGPGPAKPLRDVACRPPRPGRPGRSGRCCRAPGPAASGSRSTPVKLRLRPARRRRQQRAAPAAAGLDHPLRRLGVAGRRQQGRVQPRAIAPRRLAQRGYGRSAVASSVTASIPRGLGVDKGLNVFKLGRLTLPIAVTIVPANGDQGRGRRTLWCVVGDSLSWTPLRRPSRLRAVGGPAGEAGAARTWRAVDALIRERMDSPVPVIPALAEHLIAGRRQAPASAAHRRRRAPVPGRDDDACLKLAAAVEFIHTATLLHDDVVDGSASCAAARSRAHLIWGAPPERAGRRLPVRARLRADGRDGLDDGAGDPGRASRVIAEGEVLQLTRSHDLDLSQDVYLEIIERQDRRTVRRRRRGGRASRPARRRSAAGRLRELRHEPGPGLPAGRRRPRLRRRRRGPGQERRRRLPGGQGDPAAAAGHRPLGPARGRPSGNAPSAAASRPRPTSAAPAS